MAIGRYAFFGDSLMQDTLVGNSFAQGSTGSIGELTMEMLASIPGYGPLVSSGKRPVWMTAGGSFLGSGEVTATGAGTDVVSTDAFFKAPYGVGNGGASAVAQTLSGSGVIRKWTNMSRWGRTAVGVGITFVDYTGGGDWTYRVTQNGVAGSWTANGFTMLHNNNVVESYFPVTLAPGDTIEIRGADASGTTVGALPLFVEWFWLDPTNSATSGIIGDLFAVSGSTFHTLAASTSGDPMACFDSIHAGVGWGSSTISRTPNLGLIGLGINDAGLNNLSNFNTDIGTILTRLSPLGPVTWINPWECSTSTFTSSARMQGYRDQAKYTCGAAATRPTVIDMYDEYALLGFTGTAACAAAGFTSGDFTHQLAAGSKQVADRLYWSLRNRSASIGQNVQAWAVGSSGIGSSVDTFGGRAAFIAAGIASLAGGGAFAASGVPTVRAAGTLAGGGTLTASGIPTVRGTCALAGGGTFSSTGTRKVLSTAAFSAGGTLTAVGQDVQIGTGDLELGGTFTAAGTPTVLGVALFVGSTDLDYLTDEFDDPITDEFGDPIVATPAAFNAEGVVTHLATAVFAGGGTFSAVSQAIQSGAAAMLGGGTLRAAGTPTVLATASLVGGGTFTATGTRTAHGTAAANGGGTFTAVGQDVVTATATLAGGGTSHASGIPSVVAHAALQGGGTFSATGIPTVRATATLAGGGTFACNASGVLSGTASFAGGGTFHAAGTPTVRATATFSAGGTFAATGLRKVNSTASLSGGGTFLVVGQDVQTGTASLAAGGSFVASALVKVPAVLAANFGGTFIAVGHDQPPAGIGSGVGRQKVSWRTDQRVSIVNDQRVSYRGRR